MLTTTDALALCECYSEEPCIDAVGVCHGRSPVDQQCPAGATPCQPRLGTRPLSTGSTSTTTTPADPTTPLPTTTTFDSVTLSCLCVVEKPCIAPNSACFERNPFTGECPSWTTPCRPSIDSNNEGDTVPVFRGAPFSLSVDRKAAVGYVLLRPEVDNKGGVLVFALYDAASRRRAASDYFQIDSATGVVSVAGDLTDAPNSTVVYLTAHDGTYTGTALASIEVVSPVSGGSDFSETSSNDDDDNTMWYVIAGAVAGVLLVGVCLLLLAGRINRRRQRPELLIMPGAELKQDATFTRAVCFHHLRFDQPVLSLSDHTLLAVYRFLELPTPALGGIPGKRYNLRHMLTTQVIGTTKKKR